MFNVDLHSRKELFHGIFALAENENGVTPKRLTEKLLEFYRSESESWGRYASGNAGVTLQCKCRAKKVAMAVDFGTFARPYFGFDVMCDGKLVKRFTENGEMKNFAFETELPGEGVRHITIAFPWQVECCVTAFQLDDVSVLEPVVYSGQPLLMLGDSITQGFEVPAPGESYAALVAAFRGGEWINLAVGGTVMDHRTVAEALNYPWDKAVLAFGVNDSSKKIPLEKFREETMKSLTLLCSRAGAEIFLFTPLPWYGCPADHPEEFAVGHYRQILHECAALFPQVHSVEGTTLLDNDGEYFADNVHPNSAGMKMIAERVTALLGTKLK